MALKWADRVQETFTTTGTGTISLGGAATGYQTFASSLSNSDTCYYGASDGTNWEIGLGTYVSAGNMLARTQILASSNASSAVNWAAGTKNIWLNFPASLVGTALAAPRGECQLQRSSSTQLILKPMKGNQVSFPNGYSYTVPSAGLASGSISGGCNVDGSGSSTLSAATLYYVYLWYNAGVPAIDFSLTGHATDTGSGIEIKSGDSTRVLIGMVYPQAGPIVVDSNTTGRLVASWFNRQQKRTTGNFTTTRTSTSTSVAEVNSENRAQFLSWGDALSFSSNYAPSASVGNSTVQTIVGIDGVSTVIGGITSNIWNNGLDVATPVAGQYDGQAEGFHYLALGTSISSGTVTYTVTTGSGLTAMVNI